MKDVYGVFGAGGYGREVMPLARSQIKKEGKSADSLFFVIDTPETEWVNGTRILSLKEFLRLDAKIKYLTCAVADSKARKNLNDRLMNAKILDWTVMAENCVVMDRVKIGLGSIISPFVTITSNVTIGVGFHANLYSYVGHDCEIGDYVTFAPGVKCNGNVEIEDHVYVGAGAIIRPGRADRPLTIGESAIIGMGSVVTKDIPPGVTAFGNPARIVKKTA